MSGKGHNVSKIDMVMSNPRQRVTSVESIDFIARLVVAVLQLSQVEPSIKGKVRASLILSDIEIQNDHDKILQNKISSNTCLLYF